MASVVSMKSPRLIVIRHGERADFDHDSEWKDPAYPYDPPLTPKGHEQAKEAGVRIRSLFSSPSSVRLFSSPFLRCLQTARHLADRLELPHRTEVLPQFSDVLSEYGSIHSAVRWRWAENEIDTHVHQIDTDRFVTAADAAYPAYRETNEAAAERIREAFSQLRTAHPGDNMVLVCHWYSLEVAAGLKDNSVAQLQGAYCLC